MKMNINHTLKSQKKNKKSKTRKIETSKIKELDIKSNSFYLKFYAEKGTWQEKKWKHNIKNNYIYTYFTALNWKNETSFQRLLSSTQWNKIIIENEAKVCYALPTLSLCVRLSCSSEARTLVSRQAHAIVPNFIFLFYIHSKIYLL